ncbi:excalibur calcium-binding domain-containing protein [Saccharothrix hoggarensis]|uniref:Excalibur calcium-binding domain-containing protein n=1 Tax=Saccharothrix hoggarensis TaxID=913853 RepID=A0ABW3R5G8_9PSEU
MSSGRSVAFAGVVLLSAAGAVVALALSVDGPRPVDARRVDAGPVRPGVLSVSYTTKIEVARSATAVHIAPPAPRPAPPPVATSTTVTEPPPPPPPPPPETSSTVESTTPSSTVADENCDPSYVTDGVCVPRHFPTGVWLKCEWMHEQGVSRIEVVGRDRHYLDRDRDGIACERAD